MKTEVIVKTITTYNFSSSDVDKILAKHICDDPNVKLTITYHCQCDCDYGSGNAEFHGITAVKEE